MVGEEIRSLFRSRPSFVAFTNSAVFPANVPFKLKCKDVLIGSAKLHVRINTKNTKKCRDYTYLLQGITRGDSSLIFNQCNEVFFVKKKKN